MGLTASRDQATAWWYSWDNLLPLATALDEAGYFDDVAACIYFFSKPWKWTPEYAYFQEHKTLEGFEE